MDLLKKIFGDPNARVVERMRPLVGRINALEPDIQKLSDGSLAAKTGELKERSLKGEPLDDLLPEAFALTREAAWRTLRQRHYDVQLMGGITLHRGQIAEMRTGEGKTLVATLAVVLNAIPGKGVHVVTVNDYLARRDAAWMGQIYDRLGLTVGCINHMSSYRYDPHYRAASVAEGEEQAKDAERDLTASFRVDMDYMRPVSRQEAYLCDITYGTNNEFGFDYLRDNMAVSADQKAQRELNYAVVDEVDSILVDEARTPLIISAPAEESTDLYYRFAETVAKLNEGTDYNVDEKMRAVAFNEEGQEHVAKLLGSDPWATQDVTAIYHLDAALRAQALFRRDKEYVVREGEVLIVDEFTGRLMHGRRYSEGLHQAIEAKEGVKIQRESRTLATVTFQNYFRLYRKLSGMTGTAATEAEEFSKIYRLEVTTIPTNKQPRRDDLPDRVYRTVEGKFKAAAAEIRLRHEAGQPVLVGTISVEQNERLSHLLELEGIPHNILNAKNHDREAEFIAQAGRRGAVTVATNMAGRGVDIILGGNPVDPAEAAVVRDLGGLLVIGTERHESRRIDNQLRGRAGRQGDPGASQFYVSMEDDLMRIFGSDRMKSMMEKLGIPEDVPIENGMVSRSIESAQKKVEGHNFDIRKHLLEYDDVLNKHREGFYRRRHEIMTAAPDAVLERVFEMVEREIEQVVLFHAAGDNQAEWDLEEIYEVAHSIFPVPKETRVELSGIWGEFERKGDPTSPEASWGKQSSYGKVGGINVRTAIIRYLAGIARADFDAMRRDFGDDLMVQACRGISLRAMDNLWIEHLDAVDHLRKGIGLRSYGQRDPLVEYKKEAYRLWNEFLHVIDRQIVYAIFKIQPAVRAVPSSLLQRHGLKISGPAKESSDAPPRPDPYGAGSADPYAGKEPAIGIETGAPLDHSGKVGRNEPCPCGSGKKYKKCHGA